VGIFLQRALHPLCQDVLLLQEVQTRIGTGGPNPGQGGNPGSASEAVNSLSNLPDPNPKIGARINDQSYKKSYKKKKVNKKTYSQIMDELEN